MTVSEAIAPNGCPGAPVPWSARSLPNVRSMLVRLASLTLMLAAGAPALAQQALPVPTALPFLDLTPSPGLVGFGGGGVAQHGAAAYGALQNPALLGMVARDLVSETVAGPGASSWRGMGDIQLAGGAQFVGIDARAIGLPIAAGAAISWSTLAYGDRVLQGGAGSYEPTDGYRALSLGAASTGNVRFAAGATVRRVSTTDRVVLHGDEADVSYRRAATADFGLAMTADVASLAESPRLAVPGVGVLRPALDVTAGYAQAHIGGRVQYSGGDWQALPRTARLGWGGVAGLDVLLGSAAAQSSRRQTVLRAVELEFASQAETRLVREPSDGVFTYAPALGDVHALDALLGRGDATVTGRRGVRVAALETVSFSWGVYGGGGFDNVRSSAFEVRLAGPLKALALLTGSPRIAGAAQRLDLRWTRAVTYAGSSFETTMHGFAVIVRR